MNLNMTVSLVSTRVSESLLHRRLPIQQSNFTMKYNLLMQQHLDSPGPVGRPDGFDKRLEYYDCGLATG